MTYLRDEGLAAAIRILGFKVWQESYWSLGTGRRARDHRTSRDVIGGGINATHPVSMNNPPFTYSLRFVLWILIRVMVLL